MHGDNSSNTTARSGNPLDVDTRWSRVLMIAIEAMISTVELALKKHEHVELVVVSGNHDTHSAVAIAIAAKHYFRNEPRVSVPVPHSRFHYVEFGRVLLGFTHGDTVKKAETLAGVMATDQAQAWGRTEHRHWIVGHVHHRTVQEVHGCTVETLNTLAAKDAWHHQHGYRAKRSMVAITYHREYGEIERHTCGIRRAEAE